MAVRDSKVMGGAQLVVSREAWRELPLKLLVCEVPPGVRWEYHECAVKRDCQWLLRVATAP